jgi:hypothetical protein
VKESYDDENGVNSLLGVMEKIKRGLPPVVNSERASRRREGLGFHSFFSPRAGDNRRGLCWDVLKAAGMILSG